MLLAIDMGNTNMTLGVFDGKKLLLEARLQTVYGRMPDQYAAELYAILQMHGMSPADIDGVVVSSVTPSLDATITEALHHIVPCSPMFVGPGIKTGIDIRLKNPAQLGADLLVGAVAAVAAYGSPCIIWDLGTATTVSAIGEGTSFLGGAIIPGVNTAYESLVSRASLLPHIRLETPPCIIGRETVESMQSGALYGTAATIDGMTARIQRELGGNAPVIVTGGLAHSILPFCECEAIYDEHLLLTGLRLVYEKNR